MKLSICSPMGGYGNHLRWLALSNEGTIDFIKKFVYPKNRTCFNWIDSEWKFRQILNKKIHFEHTIDKLYDQNNVNKIIVLHINPRNALKAYLKFNPALSTLTPNLFLHHIGWQNQTNENFKLKDTDVKITLKSEDLYNEVLNEGIYTEIVDFFNLPNSYNIANEIHKLWYDLHQQAEKDVLQIETKWNYTDNIEKPQDKDYNDIKDLICQLYKKEVI